MRILVVLAILMMVFAVPAFGENVYMGGDIGKIGIVAEGETIFFPDEVSEFSWGVCGGYRLSNHLALEGVVESTRISYLGEGFQVNRIGGKVVGIVTLAEVIELNAAFGVGFLEAEEEAVTCYIFSLGADVLINDKLSVYGKSEVWFHGEEQFNLSYVSLGVKLRGL